MTRSTHRAALVVPALALALLVSGCSPRRTLTANPERTPIAVESQHELLADLALTTEASVRERPLTAPVVQVWAVLRTAFMRLGIEPTEIDAGDGIMEARRVQPRTLEGSRLSLWLDCGRGPTRAYADEHEVTLTVVVQLLPAGNEATVLRTIVDAYARSRTLSSNAIHCISTGRIERRMGEMVEEELVR